MNLISKTCNDIKAKKDAIVMCSHFKIGKTGQSLSDRFENEYKDNYDRIIEIYSSPNKTLIDDLEKWLIGYFQESKYSSKCDNEAIGGGEMDKSSEYCVYVVVKKD